MDALRGWQHPSVAAHQLEAFRPLLHEMYSGRPREDFAALATAVKTTGMVDPLILEVGCGSGWNAEVLRFLLGRPFRYVGLDYSPAMIELGRSQYPTLPFVVGDALSLPVTDAACDIVISGTVLMHLLDYHQAIEETRRVARQYCIFHTVVVMQRRETTFFRKRAYGRPVVEVVFNEQHLIRQFREGRLQVTRVLPSIPYDLSQFLGEPTCTRTYLCRVL
jgi:SAM-dependent methyltransferase